jgi:hypothetical protein
MYISFFSPLHKIDYPSHAPPLRPLNFQTRKLKCAALSSPSYYTNIYISHSFYIHNFPLHYTYMLLHPVVSSDNSNIETSDKLL